VGRLGSEFLSKPEASLANCARARLSAKGCPLSR
jgi:hypothetical protein